MINPHRAEFITIKKTEYESLKRTQFQMQCLESGGVDNWEWYSESLQPFYKKFYPEDYEDAHSS